MLVSLCHEVAVSTLMRKASTAIGACAQAQGREHHAHLSCMYVLG
jgi:hypothetical protein